METLKSLISYRPGEVKQTYCYTTTTQVSIPVEKNSSGLYCVADDSSPESASKILSSYMGSRSLKFTSHELDRLPHELVCALFTNQQPRRMCECVPALHDVDDGKTPDAYISDCFLEVGTSVLGSEHAYDIKWNGPSSYRRAVLNRNKHLLVLGVGSESVTSNFHLTDDAVEAIVTAYCFGRAIQLSASVVGFSPSRGEESLKAIISDGIHLATELKPPSCDLSISDELWSAWSSASEETWIYDTLIKESAKKVVAKLNKKGENKGFEKDVDRVREYLTQVHSLKLHPEGKKKRLPIILAEVKVGSLDARRSIDTSEHIGVLWEKLLEDGLDGHFGLTYDECEYIDKTVEKEEEERMDKAHISKMRAVNRKSVSLPDSAIAWLSSKGYLGKIHNPNSKIEHNTQSEFGFPLDDRLNTEDLDLFVNSAETLLKPDGNQALTWQKAKTLLEAGGFKETEKSWQFAEDFYSTKLGRALSFLSAVSSEINVNIRKPTKNKEFYVNRIPGYCAAIAIHNTGSDKHSFYTIIVEKDSFIENACFSCFRQWFDIGDYMASDLCSTRRHDLAASLCSAQTGLEMLSTTLDVFSSPQEVNHSLRGVKEFLFHMLVKLENANQTSELLQQVRYCYMKANSSRLISEPFLTSLEKFPIILRSRVAAWATRKIIHTFLTMSENRESICLHTSPTEETDEDVSEKSQDTISGLLSTVTGQQLRNYEEALLLSYGGIYHNKDKSESLSSNMQIFVKMTKEELKVKKDPSMISGMLGDIDSSQVPDHGFHQTHMANCALSILENLKSRGITEEDLNLRIASNLDKVTYEELATFKASLDMSHLESAFDGAFKDVKFDPSVEKSRVGKTIRAIEGVLDVLRRVDSNEVRPYRVFSQIMDLCLNLGGIVTVMFKKGQIGGVREIFILTMISRMVVRFSESIARTIADCCPNEYLTKGTQKINSTPTHYQLVKNTAQKGDVVVSMFDSLDCKTWAQGFVFPAFGSMFSVLTRSWPELSFALKEVYNLASVKRHEMPENVMRKFIEKPDIRSFQESMNVLKDEFLGEGGKLNLGHLSIMVKNMSNFMQGIFHYTSTVVHSGHLLMMSKVMRKYMMKMHTIREVVHTTKESSDDGSSLLTCVLKQPVSELDVIKTRVRSLVASEILIRSYPFMCARISEPKSTRCVETGVEEFNSYWSYRNTVLSIPTKFGAAAIMLKVTQSCIERQRVDHNSLKDCLSNGSTMEAVKVLEIGQAINHYETVGLHTLQDEVWSDLTKSLMKTPHPACWFYIASPRIIGPTLGFDMTLYSYLKTNPLARQVNYTITAKVSGSFDGSSGMVVQSSIVVGRTDRYKGFLKRISKMVDREKCDLTIDENPSMLYKPSITLDEVRTKISLKAHAQGASRSFQYEDATTMHVVSSYLCTAPCLTISFKNFDTWQRKKMSLPSFLMSVRKLMTEAESNVELDDHAKSLLEMIGTYTYLPAYIGRRRKIPVKLRMPKTRSSCEASLLSVASMMWFSIPNGYTIKENNHFLTEYQKIYPWLRDSYYQTYLEFGKLGVEDNTHLVIRSLLDEEADKDKTVTFLHTGRKSNTMMGTFLSCLEYCQRKNCRLIRPDTLSTTTSLGLLLDLEKEIFPYVSIHPAIRRLTKDNLPAGEAIAKAFKDRTEFLRRPRTDRELRMLPKRYRRLLTIGQCLLADGDQDAIKDYLINVNGSYILSYIVPQTKSELHGKWVWRGKGVIRVDLPGTIMILTLEDSKLISIAMSNPKIIGQYLHPLKSIIRRLNIATTAMTKTSLGIKLIMQSPRVSTSVGAPVVNLSWSAAPKLTAISVKPKIEPQKCISLDISTTFGGKVITSEPIKFFPKESGLGLYNQTLSLEDGLNVIDKSREKTLEDFISKSLKDRISALGFGLPKSINKLLKMADEVVLNQLPDNFDELMDDFMAMNEETMSEDEFLNMATNFNWADVPLDAEEDEAVNMAGFLDAFDINETVEDGLMFVELQNKETEGKNFRELILWDNVINGFSSVLKLNFHDVCSGNYHHDPELLSTIEATSTNRDLIASWKLLTRLRELGIIPEPRLTYLEPVVEEGVSSFELDESPDSYDIRF